MCVDYRKLNQLTGKDQYPLPRIDDIFISLHDAHCFLSLDLLMGYHQIPVPAEDRPKTAFVTHKGLFVFTVMPFGLCNAPATFQRLMDTIFRNNIGSDIAVYLDDLLLYALLKHELLPVFDRTLEQLIVAGLKCKPKKCQIFPKEMHYLGHVISKGTIAADRSKLDKVREWPFPNTGVEMASFLGLCNYYRRLIPHYAEAAVPLYKQTNENAIVASDELRASFAALKKELCDSVSVRIPNPERPFIVETDASLIAVGAVLKQSDTEEYPTLFYSMALNPAQRNYSTYERELLAVVKACDAFRVFLLGNDFLLRTDHRALAAIFNSPLSTSSRVSKWLLALQPFCFKIEIIPGKENVVADSLSRIPWPITEGPSEVQFELVEGDDDDSSQTESIEDVAELAIEVAEPDPVLGVRNLLGVDLTCVAIESLQETQRNEPDLQTLRCWIERKS